MKIKFRKAKLRSKRTISAVVSNNIFTAAVIVLGFGVLAWANSEATSYTTQYDSTVNSNINELARARANMTQEVEKEKKSQVRPYIMMPYFASLLLVATTTMMLSFTSGTFGVAATGPPKDLGTMKEIFMTACIFHSYLIGIVAGKISEESVAAGFKHTAILAPVSVIAAKIVPVFINLG